MIKKVQVHNGEFLQYLKIIRSMVKAELQLVSLKFNFHEIFIENSEV